MFIIRRSTTPGNNSVNSVVYFIIVMLSCLDMFQITIADIINQIVSKIINTIISPFYSPISLSNEAFIIIR